MQKFTVKVQKNTFVYEIFDYPYFDTWQYLKVTRYRKGKYCGEESFDLSKIKPEFLEIRSGKKPVAPLISAWFGIAFFVVIFSTMSLSLFFSGQLILSISCLVMPLAVGVHSLNYIIQRKKGSAVSSFVFDDEEFSRFEIPYMRNDRAGSYAIAQKIAAYCNQALYNENKLPVQTYQFANGLAELRDCEVVIFNGDGVKCGGCDYISVVPGVYHHQERHMFRNFVCTFLALFFWFGTLFFIIGTAITLKDRELIFGFSIMYIIPFSLGCFFFSKCRKSQNYYFAGDRFDEYSDSGIYLEVGKHPGNEKKFITELNRRLRKAHNEYK